MSRSSVTLKGQELFVYPLRNFKSEKLYTDNIDYLLNSPNSNQRILAYLVIGASNDSTKETILLDRINTEKNKGGLIWAGMALLYLQDNHTTAIFDFLVKNEDFGDAHMLPFFIQLDKDSLQQTAYSRMNNKDTKSKILAAQTLSVTALNSKTEDLLKQAVQTWDMDIKGYAIYSLKELRIGNLLEIFKPLLNDKRTRSIALEALANSPTEADRNYLFELVSKKDTLSRELLDCFYDSKNIDNIKYWLKLLYTKPIAKDSILGEYSFSTYGQPLIHSDSVLQDVQIALQNIKDKQILGDLVSALDERTDDKSVAIIVTLLKHKNSTVRYWTAKTVENNTSEKFKTAAISKLIKRGLKDGNTPDD
jgi:HEAT repeat protein